MSSIAEDEAKEMAWLKKLAIKEGMQFKDVRGKTALELRRFVCLKRDIPPPSSPRKMPVDALWGDGKEASDPIQNKGYNGGHHVVQIPEPMSPKVDEVPPEVLTAVEAAARG
jgi:hypothetical protein